MQRTGRLLLEFVDESLLWLRALVPELVLELRVQTPGLLPLGYRLYWRIHCLLASD